MTTHRIERGPGWELRNYDWRDDPYPSVQVDAVIEDPPYGSRTHAGQRHERKTGTSGDLVSDAGLQYDHLTPEDVGLLVVSADVVCRGWCAWMTSHDLIPAYEDAAKHCSPPRYVFAPVPIVIPGMNVRLAGDGPSNWAIHLVVTRTKTKKCWGTKPGAYIVDRDRNGGKLTDNAVKGGKPLGLMEALIRDYTDPGDMVMDRFSGGGTTGVAAVRNGRRFIGYERDAGRFEIALARLRETREIRGLFDATTGEQKSLLGD